VRSAFNGIAVHRIFYNSACRFRWIEVFVIKLKILSTTQVLRWRSVLSRLHLREVSLYSHEDFVEMLAELYWLIDL